MTVLLAGRDDVTLDAFERVAWGGEDVELAPAALERMAACRQEFLALLDAEPTLSVYGVTTGTGERAGQGLAAAAQLEEATRAPVNGSSFGEPLPERVVRGIVLARLTGFVEGNAAVRPELALAVAALLDGPLPEVPARGNAGSGEILALGHLFNGIGIPLELKEPIALVNGSPCAAALVADGALLARRRLPRAEQVFALAVEAIAAPLGAFAAELEPLWDDPEETAALQALRDLLAGAAAERRTYQAPVSFRILPRVLARSRRALAEAERAASVSLRAVTDNPVFVPSADGRPATVLSNGSYHNAMAAPALDGLAAAAADLVQIAERQTEAILDELLTEGICPHPLSTLSMVQAAWAEDARAAAQATILPLGGLGQNDTPAPAFIAWDRCRRAGECLDAALATLAVVASQGLHEHGRPAPPALTGALDEIRGYVPLLEEPRPIGPEVGRLAAAFVNARRGSPTSHR